MKFLNHKNHKLEEFQPIDPKNIRIYVCGPTVYDRAHMGNARSAVVFDLLVRVLRHEYENVTYVRNITDVDDKINQKAKETGRSIQEITNETTDWFHQDMAEIGVLPPDFEPKATEYIAQMIAMIEKLIEQGYAYEAENHVLYAVESFDNYGKFSGRTIDEMLAGARVDIASYKRNPMDFVLWKPSQQGEPAWESPWGQGRPGWHIECSAMSKEILGEVFDIHGGGLDLKFPHHENEIAQSCACNQTDRLANYWLHNEMLLVEGKKMSKSLGNFFTVREILDKGISGNVLRFILLSTHYSKPMDWTEEKVKSAQSLWQKWQKSFEQFDSGEIAPEVLTPLQNDLNSAGAIAALHQLYADGNFSALKASLEFMGFDVNAQGAVMDFTAYEAIFQNLRKQAVASKDFTKIDTLKLGLAELGLTLQMHKDGVQIAGELQNFDALDALFEQFS